MVGEDDLYHIIRHRQRTTAANIRISPLLANETSHPEECGLCRPREASERHIYSVSTLSGLRNVSDIPTLNDRADLRF